MPRINAQIYLAAILSDNPNYERYIRSDLRQITALIQNGAYSVGQLKREYHRVKASKWTKYSTVHALLVLSHPELIQCSANGVKNLMCKSPDTIVLRHEFRLKCDCGKHEHLAHIQTRERVWWNPPQGVRPYIADETYRSQGVHNGIGIGRGDQAKHTDDHKIVPPPLWNLNALADAAIGTTVTYEQDQEYEWAPLNRTNWQRIPNSQYKIRRTAKRKRGQVEFKIQKTGQGMSGSAKTVIPMG